MVFMVFNFALRFLSKNKSVLAIPFYSFIKIRLPEILPP
jgi:hypothetical protein